jgi:hypothetical protein
MTLLASSHPESAAASEPGTAPPPRLLDVMRARMRRLDLSLRTEEAYVSWGWRFAVFVCDAVVVSGFPSPTPAFGDDVLAREWRPVCAVLSRDEVQALLAQPAGPGGMTRYGTRPDHLRRASAGSCAVCLSRPALHASRRPRGCAACASPRGPREHVA